jgi:hypothetical protein
LPLSTSTNSPRLDFKVAQVGFGAEALGERRSRRLGIFLPPPFTIPNMSLSSAVGKIDDERMCLKLIGCIAGR